MSCPTASCRCSCTSFISITSSARSSRNTRAASSRVSSSKGPLSGKPRAISSGCGAEASPLTVATMISTPSSESRRRSRSATSLMSPTLSPSTNVTPVATLSAMRTPSRDSSTTDPFSAITIAPAGTPASRANRGVVAVRDACHRGHRLALRSRAEDQLLLRPELFQLLRLQQHAFGDVHVPEVARDVRVLPHRTSDDRNLAPRLDGHVDRLLHAMHVRRERGDEHATAAQRDDLAERLADDALRRREPGPLGVRRVAEQEVDPP